MDDSLDLTEATTEIKAEPSYRPDAKARRYDRQLRLWASAGQRSLEAARVLLVGCDATGCQALKNLVLPGIAHFTILSDKITTPQDVATNFFLHPDSVGQPIAAQAVELLRELNPSVDGAAQVANASDLVASDRDFFLSFTLIICSNVEPQLELALADLLWSSSALNEGSDIPLITVRNSGFIGRIQVQLREHCVIDTHPEQSHTLRIDQPFPNLEKMARALDLDSMDSMEHSHVPWVVLLVRAVSLWREQHGGRLPDSNSDEERAAFKASIQSGRQKTDEENFDEALAQAYRGWTKTEVEQNLVELFKEPSVQTISANSKNLHILLAALKEYIAAPPFLPPVSPALPDMHSSTVSYIALQNLFKAQFSSDLARYNQCLAAVLQKAGLPADTVPVDEVENFARNVGAVALVSGRSLRESKEFVGLTKEVYGETFTPDSDERPLHLAFHLALLASEQFYSTHQRWPGTADDTSQDSQEVEEAVLQMLNASGSSWSQLGDETINAIREVVRGGFSTLPTTAAFLGGIVAQEVIKLVTNQYMPLDNVVIANLVQSSLERYKF